MDALRLEIKQLIIDVLMIENKTPDAIDNAAPLFGEGLGLDSVDALELAMELEDAFGVTLPDNDATREVFASVNSLAAYISEHRS